MTQKRSRSSKACTRCHDKKIKCDVSTLNPCSNCAISRSDCIIYERKKRAKAASHTVSESYKEKEKLLLNDDNLNDMSDSENLSPTTPFHGSFLKPNAQQKYPHLSHTYLNPNVLFKENMKQLMKVALNGDNNPTMKSIFDNSVDMITENKRTRSYNLDQMDFDVLNLFGCLTIPDDETCWKYIDSFFTSFNTQYPIIDKRRFYHDYKDIRNPPSLLLLNSILYLGSWNSVVPVEEKDDILQMSEIFFKRAKLIYDYGIETDPIPLIQSLLCFVFHSDNMSSLSKNDYYWTKTAVTVAYQYQFHQMPTSTDSYERRIRIRLWWMLVLKDRITALGFSKPTLIDLSWDAVRTLQMDDLKDSDMTLLEMNYFVQLSRMAILIGKIIEEQSEINRLHSQRKPILKLIKKCDNLMINYLRDVPNELKTKLDDESTHSFLSILLSSFYYSILVLIHKANILRKTADNYPSWSISFQASQIIKASIDCFAKKNMIGKIIFFPHNILSSSALIMMYHLYNEDERISKIANDFFLKILSIWSHSSKKWPGSYPLLCVFGQIYNSDEIKKHLLNSVTNNNIDKTPVDPFNSSDISIIFNSKSRIDVKLQTATNISELGVDFDKLFVDKVFTNEDLVEPDLDFIKKFKGTIFHDEVGVKKKREDSQNSNSNYNDGMLPLLESTAPGPPVSEKHELNFSDGKITNLTQQMPPIEEDSSFWMLQKDWQPRFNFDSQFNPVVQSHQPPLPLHHNRYGGGYSQHHHLSQPQLQPTQPVQLNAYQHSNSVPHNICYADTHYTTPVDTDRSESLPQLPDGFLPQLQQVPQPPINRQNGHGDDVEHFINPFAENKDPFAYFKTF